MNASSHIHSRGRLITLTLTGLTVLALVTVGVYGLLTGPHTEPPSPPEVPGPVPTITGPATPTPRGGRLWAVPASADPDRFARNVADAVFTWDTTTGLGPLDYTSVLLNTGDPSGAEQAGLASDIATYLPTQDAWAQLRKTSTTQHLTITHTGVPASWSTVLGQARPGQLAPGTTAITIDGTRHRTGTWNNHPVTSEHPVAFTVFLICAPTYPTCHLLRLSQPDNPLR